MPTFRYTAVNAAGNAFQEEVEDVSAKNVVERLQEQGYTVNEIVEITIAPKEPSTHLRLSWRDLDLFMQQLHMITHAKMPIASALAQLSTELETPGLKPILERVRADLEAGNTLEYALSRHPKAFPPLYLALIHAGSEGGNMAAVLETLTNYSRSDMELRSRLAQVLVYPVALITTAIALIVFFLLYIVPIYADVFQTFGVKNPPTTQVLINLSDTFRHNPISISTIATLAVFTIGMLLYLACRPGPRSFLADRLHLLLPFVGKVYALASMARFIRALGMLLNARLPIVDSLELAGAAADNTVLQQACQRAKERVARGEELDTALTKSGYFNKRSLWAISNALKQGTSGEMLFQLAADYEFDVDQRRKWLLSVFSPITIIFIGLTIGFIMLALYTPLFAGGDIVGF